MSTTILSTTQETIERSIFEVIRKELVDKGYLPDITLFPDTEVGFANYNNAILSIIAIKGFAIELFNEGSNIAKGVKKIPRIVINTGNFLPGALGGDPQKYFSNQGLSYQALVTPPQTVDFFLNIHLVSNTVEQERILNSLIALAVQRRGYIPFYDGSDDTFFCRYLNFFHIDDLDAGIIEKVYAYQISDCWDREDKVIDSFIAKMTEITLHPNVMKHFEGTWGETEVNDLIVRYTPKGLIGGKAIVSGTLVEHTYILGPELFINGNFALWTDGVPDGWDLNHGSNGPSRYVENALPGCHFYSSSSQAGINQEVCITGHSYHLSFNLFSLASGKLELDIPGIPWGVNYDVPGIYTIDFIAAFDGSVTFTTSMADNPNSFVLRDCSLKEIL